MLDDINLDSIIRGRVDPYIYAFETNTVPNFLKVGDTYRPVEVRLDEWRKIYTDLIKKYEHIAKVDDNTYFRDYAVHDYLIQNGYRRIEKDDFSQSIYLSNEFFKDAKKENVEEAIKDIQKSFELKDNRYSFYNSEDNLPLGDFEFSRDVEWSPRDNQKNVIDKFTEAYGNGRNNLLMFAVMRFGKSFTSLCCAKAMNAKLTVVVCGKTAVRMEWKENVQRPKILDGFEFIDSKAMSRNLNIISEKLAEGKSCVVFLTMQDLIGDDIKTRHADLFNLNNQKKLDLLIIDETHFGARAEEFGKVLGTTANKSISKIEKTNGYDESFDELEKQIKVFSPKVKLHLSGTPYRILLDNEFESDDIIGMVQYSDIIDEKEKWDKENLEIDEWDNPYYGFPQMIRFAFNLNKSAKAKLADLKNNGYAYDLDELFTPESTSKADERHNQFKNKAEVLDLLRAIDGSKEDDNIFSFLNYDKIKKNNMCRHIVMVLPYCASCDAMENLLRKEQFNNLNDYEIINIAGFDSEKIMSKSDYAACVKEKIEKYESEGKKTISLTVGKMLTGSTVKEWDTMIFLRNTSSPQDYDQASFRLQSQYVKTIKNDNGKIIKRDMKPQTIFVDFDPVRMYSLQHKKSLIANINKAERGNEFLEDKLKRELEIAPIICMNHFRLQKIEATDIVDSIRQFNAQKSVMDETFEVDIDERIFEDTEIKAIIQKQPEITNKGINFETSANNSGDDEGTDIETPDTGPNVNENQNNESKDKLQNEEDENKKLASKLQGYYFKLLLFAFLSEKEEKTILDIITHMEDNEDCKRLGKNLVINVEELRLVRDRINPAILSYLENKIQNINQLGKEITLGTIETALRKMSRLSVSEIVTPNKVAKELVDIIPDNISANSKFLDIASKTGEFAIALIQRYGYDVCDNIYSIPTSSVTYECTRKIYRCLGLPIEHIYYNYTSYDLIDETKNEEILKELKDMKFDAIIGNPPYQVIATGDANGSDPIYHLFIDTGKQLCNREILIHPARFLFNAGKTPKDWNQKVLNDEHFKVAGYWADSSQMFPDVDIKGGVAITYWDNKSNFGKIGTFVAFEELRSILKKVKNDEFKTFSDLVYGRDLYKLTEVLYSENSFAENRQSKGHRYDCGSNIFDIFPELFYDEKPKDNKEYARILGRTNNTRIEKWFRKDYLRIPDNFDFYKVFVPKSNGSGAIGEVLSTPMVGEPMVGCTTTFLNIGKFETQFEAESCLKYIKTKFARAMLGTLKVTQDNPRETWLNVPLQDFTSNSDIDWSKSIPEIDKQMYKKYGLSPEEISFIESKVKEM